MSRPDKLRATRTGGFANVEMVFDGKTFTILGKDANIYAQADVPGTVDQMVDEIRDKYTSRSRAPICCSRMSTTS